MYVWAPFGAVPTEARREFWNLGTGVTDGCKYSCGCWELNHSLAALAGGPWIQEEFELHNKIVSFFP